MTSRARNVRRSVENTSPVGAVFLAVRVRRKIGYRFFFFTPVYENWPGATCTRGFDRTDPDDDSTGEFRPDTNDYDGGSDAFNRSIRPYGIFTEDRYQFIRYNFSFSSGFHRVKPSAP